MASTTTTDSKTQTSMPPLRFRVGDPVQLVGLNKRAELNGMRGTVVETPSKDKERYALALESGECIRVRSANIIHSAAERSSRGAKAIDPDLTLFVLTDGTLTQPAMPQNAATSAPTDKNVVLSKMEAAYKCRMSLPSGRWEVRALELDGQHIVVTLMAIEKADTDPIEWDELKGLRITRRVKFDADDADVQSAEANLGTDSTLTVVVKQAVRKPTSMAETDRWCAEPAVTRAASMGDKENVVAAFQEWSGSIRSTDEDVISSPLGTDFEPARLNARKEQRPLFSRRWQSCTTPSLHRRSRKLTNAQRHAERIARTRRRAEHMKQGADPQWKVALAQQRMAAEAC